jgi:hypothetical protein
LDADYLGKQFYGERTVSSMLSQLMLPITVGTAVSDLLASFLKVDSINYQEITTPSIQTDYSQGSQDNKISLRDFLSTLLTGSKQEIRVPNAEDQSITDVYHLSLFKNNKSVDFRIKVLVETYDNLCHKIAKEIISHDEDTSEYDNMVELTKNCLGKIFFIDHAPNGTKYTNALQISDSF